MDDISLSIGAGMFGLLGPNDAGKTTFMRILTTQLVPTSGEVVIEPIVTNLLVLNHGAVSFAGTTAELASLAVGLVHEIVVPIEAINSWLESGRVSSITQHGATATLRVLGEPPLGSVGAEPTMEEGYLLHQVTISQH